jgi:hypothetical protein
MSNDARKSHSNVGVGYGLPVQTGTDTSQFLPHNNITNYHQK